MSRRVLVTGCAGFIGSHTCEALLRAGYRVAGIDDLSAGRVEHVPAGVDFAGLDVRDPAVVPLFEGVDAVFHLAARNCPSDCLSHPVETADINVRGTAQVLEACRLAGVAKVIYADSSAVYEGIRDLPAGVDRVAPLGPYAITKHAGAELVRSHARYHGLRATVLRYFNVYGARQDDRRAVPPVMVAFAQQLLAGRAPVIYGRGDVRRDFVDVEDVCRVHLLCLAEPRTDGRTFDVGTGRSVSVLDVYEEVARLVGRRVPPRHLPALPGEAAETLADPRPLAALGWRPRMSLQDGLRCCIQHLTARGGGPVHGAAGVGAGERNSE